MKGINTLVNADCSDVSRRAYFDADVFAEEQKPVFGRAWQFVAHASEFRAMFSEWARVMPPSERSSSVETSGAAA